MGTSAPRATRPTCSWRRAALRVSRKIVGDKAMAARRRARIEKAVAAMRRTCGTRSPVLSFRSTATAWRRSRWRRSGAGWRSWREFRPTTMARRMAEALQTEHWTTPLPVPTVDRKDRRWKSDAYWRGDVWPAPNYQIATGLARYGHKELAADIADKTVANAMKNGISEHYDSSAVSRLASLSWACPAPSPR